MRVLNSCGQLQLTRKIHPCHVEKVLSNYSKGIHQFAAMRSKALLLLGASMHASPGYYNQLPDCAHSCPEGVMNMLQHTVLQLIYQLDFPLCKQSHDVHMTQNFDKQVVNFCMDLVSYRSAPNFSL